MCLNCLEVEVIQIIIRNKEVDYIYFFENMILLWLFLTQLGFSLLISNYFIVCIKVFVVNFEICLQVVDADVVLSINYVIISGNIQGFDGFVFIVDGVGRIFFKNFLDFEIKQFY